MELVSGYGTKYDPFPVLDRLESDHELAFDELWENLYHQGDVGSASYAAVPILVQKGELSLVAAIEVARHKEHNPEIPSELVAGYNQALAFALETTPKTEEQFQDYYIIHASVNGQHQLAKALNLLSITEILAEYE
ncbi:MAG: hypothetical protein GY705_18300 [Bacteroidetes bacterium]|nr:hypothetical protein [Bacteroidota bacterium]